jgi:hypothetical protein
MAGAYVVTIASPAPIAPTNVVAVDVENDTPVVVAYAGRPPIQGAEVVSLSDDLPPEGGSGEPGDLAAHVADTTPHPVYDDMPSLSLLFQNGLI